MTVKRQICVFCWTAVALLAILCYRAKQGEYGFLLKDFSETILGV